MLWLYVVSVYFNMFKCKEQVIKYNPSKLFTLAQLMCINNNISLSSVYHIQYQLPSENIQIVYNKYCPHLGCDLSEEHDHIERSNDYKFYNPHCTTYRNKLVSQVLPFNEFSNIIHEQRKRAVKRRLHF